MIENSLLKIEQNDIDKMIEIGMNRREILHKLKVEVENENKEEVFKYAMKLCSTKPKKSKIPRKITIEKLYKFLNKLPAGYINLSFNK